LASDGFLALVSDYGAYSADSLMAAALDKGLAALGDELRAIEAADPDGARFARFKKSDDATAILLRLDGQRTEAFSPAWRSHGRGEMSQRGVCLQTRVATEGGVK
jgi:hypothetical protein